MRERPIIIVDPFSSGVELAPAFAERGHPAIAVLSSIGIESCYPGSPLRSGDFRHTFLYTPEMVSQLALLKPLGVLPGAESGVEIADVLARALTRHRANDPALAAARRHKGLMHDAVARSGLAVIRGVCTDNEDTVLDWLWDRGLADQPLVIKPAKSAGTDNVHRVVPSDGWQSTFDKVLGAVNILGERNQQVIVQEYVEGTEYVVDTVSANGRHVLCGIGRYRKVEVDGQMAVYEHMEFVPFDDAVHRELVAYTFGVLDALGIRWGAAHTELIVTADGPRLVETGARMHGAGQPELARLATGSSQVERLVEAFVDGRITTGDYEQLRRVLVVLLSAKRSGALENLEVLDRLRSLATHHGTYLRHRNGDTVRRTVDFMSILGRVVLASVDRDAIIADYRCVRDVECLLSIAPE